MTENAKATTRTILAQKRRDALAKTQNIILPVPNYDGVAVKFRAVSVDEVKKAADSVAKLQKSKQPVNSAARILANACEGIYVQNEDGSYEQIAPGFDYDLALSLVDGKADELPDENRLTAAMVVIMFYVTELDVISTADALTEKSGARRIEAEEDFLES
jgi:hypothetical protein